MSTTLTSIEAFEYCLKNRGKHVLNRVGESCWIDKEGATWRGNSTTAYALHSQDEPYIRADAPKSRAGERVATFCLGKQFSNVATLQGVTDIILEETRKIVREEMEGATVGFGGSGCFIESDHSWIVDVIRSLRVAPRDV